jgi:hypothetical protein
VLVHMARCQALWLGVGKFPGLKADPEFKGIVVHFLASEMMVCPYDEELATTFYNHILSPAFVRTIEQRERPGLQALASAEYASVQYAPQRK